MVLSSLIFMTFDLGEEPVDEAEVASGNPHDGAIALGIGGVFRVQGLAELVPPAL